MKTALTFRPFFAALMTIFVLQNSANAKAASFETCFQNPNGSVGKIAMNSKTVEINWDVDDFTEASRESGIVNNFKLLPASISGEATIGTGTEFAEPVTELAEPAARLQIVVAKTVVIFKEVNERKEALSVEQTNARVSCPKEANPLELAQD